MSLVSVKAFRHLCALLSPDATLVDEVLLALDSPTAYRQRFFDSRAARHSFGTAHERAWIALLDGLIDRGTAVEIDRRDSALDLADALRDTTPVDQLDVDLSALAVSDLPIPAAALLADDVLANHGLALVMLRINPVDVPVAVVSASTVQGIITAAARLGLCALSMVDLDAQTARFSHGMRRIAG